MNDDAHEDHDAIQARVSEFAATLEISSMQGALEVLTQTVPMLIPEAEFAGLTLRRPQGRLESYATTSAQIEAAEVLQYDMGEGPCLDAALTHHVVSAQDVAHDERWPRWGPAVAQTIGSVLSVQIPGTRGSYGSVNIYSGHTHAFTPQTATIATIVSVHAGIALRALSLEEGFATALASRLLIGQAQGVLMLRYGLGAEAAFAAIRRHATTHNLKIIDLARQLIDSRGEALTRPQP